MTSRELAVKVYNTMFGEERTKLPQAAALIDAALQSARLEAIEECRKECYIDETEDGVWLHMQVDGYHCSLNLSAHKGEMGYKFATRYHEAKQKEAQP
jgi:hypothetical protein